MHTPQRTPYCTPSLLRRLAAAAGVLTAAVAGPLAAQTPTGTVTGRVTAADGGAPIAAATISVTGTQLGAVTRPDGTYRLTLRPGTYELRARLIGYGVERDTVVVRAGETTTRNFTLARAASALEAVAVVGTRAEARTVTESPVPVDVLSAAEIRSTGRTETAQMLQAVAPSLNFPRPSIADGTDHVRPATLRGLGPDQVLVLINGKRRHTSALVNVNSTVGRGAAGVDLNAIPASMIERVEVLREGAAAQYGSDAIAGVINIVLKSTDPGQVSATLGQVSSSVDGFDYSDGEVMHGAASFGRAVGQGGYVNVGVEYRDRGFTNRARPDPRAQYFAGDPRNATPMGVTLRLGDAETRDGLGFLNTAYTFAGGAQAYAFGGLSKRDGKSAANWRLPNGNNTVRGLWPNGFLPLILTDIWDGSGTVGVRGSALGWQWDLASVYGRNSLRYTVDSSNNASMGLQSPRRFDAGGLAFGQSTTTLDLARDLRVAGSLPLRLAAGAEFRHDQYRINAGDEASWVDAGQPILDGPNANSRTARPAPGAQGFPGFRPADEQNVSRSNVAVYADAESDLTKRLLVGLAGRFEDYSDFGSTTTGKLTTRLALVPQLALRGAVNTGFRAPSLGQSFFSSTATNLVAGQFLEIRTLPVNTAGARALGAEPLKPEKSVDLSGGVVVEPTRNLSLTVDYYHIRITDRIVFSENFIGNTIRDRLAAIGLQGVTGARYFTNAIDTRTRGVDVIAHYGLTLPDQGVLRLTGAYNNTRTRVTTVKATPAELTGFDEQLFGRAERGRIEEAQPRDNFVGSANYDWRRLGVVLRSQRFGRVTNRQARLATNQPPDQTFGAKWVTDVSASYRALGRLTVALGADNVFDVYPDRQSDAGDVSRGYAGNANFGMNPYSGISPFGFNGRFIYARVTLGL